MRSEEPSKPKATTHDIVGGASNGFQAPAKWRRYYESLVKLREGLTRQQDGLARDALEEQPSFSTHIADAGTDAFDRDLALSMLSSDQDALYQIDQALDRIRQGTFGVCELTGKPIEPDRLEAIPWTRFSKEASRKVEQERGIKRMRVAERDTVMRAEGQSQQPDAD